MDKGQQKEEALLLCCDRALKDRRGFTRQAKVYKSQRTALQEGELEDKGLCLFQRNEIEELTAQCVLRPVRNSETGI